MERLLGPSYDPLRKLATFNLDIGYADLEQPKWPRVPRRKKEVEKRENPMLLSVQYVFRFANRWGASVIRGPFTYGGPKGLWELAVLSPRGGLHYDNPVADGDVVGYCSRQNILEHLQTIASWHRPR